MSHRPPAALRPLTSSADAFDVGNDDDTQVLRKVVQSIIHIRNQQRSGRKSLTTIAGLATDLDLLKILKFMKKVRPCTHCSQ